jgi:DNA-binding transcriptional LysR family regulator
MTARRRLPLRFDDDLGLVAVLQKAVELGSLVAACRALDVNVFNARKKLYRLEDRLGRRLVEVTTRRLRPTPAGREYLALYAPILPQVLAARAKLMGVPDRSPSLAPATAATPAAGGAVPASSPSPGQMEVLVRRLEGGQWAAVCFQRQLIRVGPTAEQVLAQLAADLVG